MHELSKNEDTWYEALRHYDTELERLLLLTQDFLQKRLRLFLHPDPPANRRAGKVFIKTLTSGLDFLGWVHFSYHRVLRTATKRRMLRCVNEENLSSYIGLCKHGNAFTLQESIKTIVQHGTRTRDFNK